VAEDEIALLAHHDTKVAFCPETSLKLAKGPTAVGKYPEMMEADVTVGLGTDGVSAAGSLDLKRQMYLAAGLFKDCRRDPRAVGAEDALRMATIDGARALGMESEIGSLEPGKEGGLRPVRPRPRRVGRLSGSGSGAGVVGELDEHLPDLGRRAGAVPRRRCDHRAG
jgi:cytosine/adenosine deaminase-related metal-dependent hydrolase